MDAASVAGTATVLFTDMVGSTELRMEIGDDRADRLRRDHDDIVAGAVQRHGGEVVKSTGDGVMAVFPATASAVDAAVAMQTEVRRYARRADAVSEISIRIGISVGDITEENDDYFGEAVIEAARLEAASQPGEILVTDLVRRMARRRTTAEFVDAGERTLKGLPEPVHTHRVLYATDTPGPTLPSELASATPLAFCGREAEIGVASSAWAAATGGTLRCCLVSGEPGIGKTTLAAVVARTAADEGATVLYGRSDDGLHLPYQPFAEIIRDVAVAAPDVIDQLGARVAELASIVPALAPDRSALRASTEPEADRARLFEAVEVLLARLAADAPVVLVLDDLQWAELPTTLLLRHLLRALEPHRILIIGTFRDTEIGLEHPLGDLLADSHRADRIDRIRLGAMGESDVAALLSVRLGAALGDQGRALAERVHDEGGGSPFFVTELVTHLIDNDIVRVGRDGEVLVAESESFSLPASIKEVVARRLAGLPPTTRETLSHAAVIGQSFELAVVAAALERDPALVLDDLEQAAGAALVHDSEGAGRFDFAHALIRATLLDETGRTRQALIHRRIAEVLEALPGEHLSELAHHWRQASVTYDVAKAVEYSRRAGRRDLNGLAWEAAALQFEHALRLLEPLDKADPVMVAETALDLAEARRQVGDATFRDAVVIAADAARASSRADLLGRAALAGMRAGWWFPKVGVVDEFVVGLCEEALRASDPDDDLHPRLLATLATNLAFDPDRSRRERLIADARAAAEGSDDAVRASVLVGEYHALWDPLTLDRREVIAGELAEIAERTRDRPLAVVASLLDVCCRMERGDLRTAEDRLLEIRPVATETRISHFLWLTEMMLVNLAIIRDEDAVEQRMDDVLQLGLAGGNEDAFAAWGGHAAALARARGGFEDMTEPLEQMVAQFPLLSAWRIGLALAAAVGGDLDRAGEIVDELTGEGRELPMDYLWMVGQFGLVDLAERLGRPELAERVWRALLPFRGRMEMTASATTSFGLTETALAEAALLTGRVDEAIELAEQAATTADALDAHYFATRSRRTLAAALRERGETDRAAAVGAQARATASARGFAEELARLGD